MKSRFIIIFTLQLLIGCTTAIAQGSTVSYVSEAQIDRLQEGTLLIKLNTQSERIEHRVIIGQKTQAEKLIEEVEKEHREIIENFKEHYTFSDYYFFLSDDSDEVILKKNYKFLFKVNKEDNTPINNLKNPFILILGIPPGYSTVDKYKFILHELSDDGISPILKPMPKVFKTQSKKIFSNKYDFDRAVRLMQERLKKYQTKVHSGK